MSREKKTMFFLKLKGVGFFSLFLLKYYGEENPSFQFSQYYFSIFLPFFFSLTLTGKWQGDNHLQ